MDVPPSGAAPSRRLLLTGLVGTLALLGSGCTIPAGGASASAGGASASASRTASTAAEPVATTPSPTGTAAGQATPAGTLALLPDARAGSGLDAPLIVNGLALINRNHPVSEAFAPKVSADYQLAPEADKAFGAMVAAARKAGLTIVWRVGYRSYATQTALSTHPPTAYGDDADSFVAKPGQSEHQAGLAVDVASKSGTGTRFPTTREFAWLRANSYAYGFVLRYPDGKTDVTGYHYEPWHYRYVGVGAAAAFGPNSNLTLEEYLGGR